MPTGRRPGGLDQGGDERANCARRPVPQRAGDLVGEIGGDDAGRHRVLEVVGAVGDAVGPGDHLALGVAGAGWDQEWLRMPSRVSGTGSAGEDDVGAPGGVVVAAREEGSRASSLAWPPGPWPQSWPRAMASVSATLSRGPGRRRWPPGRPRGRGSAGCAGGRPGTRRPGSCPTGAGTRTSAGSGRGRGRSRCARGSGSSSTARSPAPCCLVALGESRSAWAASRSSRRRPHPGPATPARESA